MSNIDPNPIGDVAIVYDGDCPLCSSYVLFYRLRSLKADVRLIDARESDPLVDEVRRRNLDLDQGMVVRYGGRYYHGADAMHLLAILGSSGGIFNRLNRAIFRRRNLARVLYPGLVFGRRVLLRLLGRRLIAES